MGGGTIGVPVEVLAISEWTGVILMILLFLVSLHRALRDKSNLATPAIAMLQAGPSFCCLGFFSARKVQGAAEFLPDMLGDVLFTCSVIGVFATVYCVARRRSALRASWFSPPWAAFT